MPRTDKFPGFPTRQNKLIIITPAIIALSPLPLSSFTKYHSSFLRLSGFNIQELQYSTPDILYTLIYPHSVIIQFARIYPGPAFTTETTFRPTHRSAEALFHNTTAQFIDDAGSGADTKTHESPPVHVLLPAARRRRSKNDIISDTMDLPAVSVLPPHHHLTVASVKLVALLYNHHPTDTQYVSSNKGEGNKTSKTHPPHHRPRHVGRRARRAGV